MPSQRLPPVPKPVLGAARHRREQVRHRQGQVRHRQGQVWHGGMLHGWTNLAAGPPAVPPAHRMPFRGHRRSRPRSAHPARARRLRPPGVPRTIRPAIFLTDVASARLGPRAAVRRPDPYRRTPPCRSRRRTSHLPEDRPPVGTNDVGAIRRWSGRSGRWSQPEPRSCRRRLRCAPGRWPPRARQIWPPRNAIWSSSAGTTFRPLRSRPVRNRTRVRDGPPTSRAGAKHTAQAVARPRADSDRVTARPRRTRRQPAGISWALGFAS